MADKETTAPQAGNQSVQLGVGTLIIIAIIVTTCSGRGEVDRLQHDTTEIKRQLAEINKKLDSLASKSTAAPVEFAPADADSAP